MGNSFLDRIRVDQATIDRCNQVAKNHTKSQKNTKPVDGGRERGDSDGPGALGRESGFKSGESAAKGQAASQGNNGGKTGGQGGQGGQGGHGGGQGGHGGHGGQGGH